MKPEKPLWLQWRTCSDCSSDSCRGPCTFQLGRTLFCFFVCDAAHLRPGGGKGRQSRRCLAPDICLRRTFPLRRLLLSRSPSRPLSSPSCRVSQPEQNQLEHWQPRCTCNIIVPVMKSALAPRGELRRVFWHGDQLDLQIYKSAAPPGLNHRLDEASAAWRRRRVANCAQKKKRILPCWSGELLQQLCLFLSY